MRRIPVSVHTFARRTVMRYIPLSALHAEWREDLSWLVGIDTHDDLATVIRLHAAGLENLAILVDAEIATDTSRFPVVVGRPDLLAPGDVVAITPGRAALQVLYRESDQHHTVFLTNRCNSLCVMCSQPPTRQDDAWLVEEAKQIAVHMHQGPAVLGFTGGEPLLLREGLREVLDVFARLHPGTCFDVLTNGRLLSDRPLATRLLGGLEARVSWMVPLYGHADFLHDRVVQAEGAFDETIDGLLTLQEFAQPIQLRIVLIEPVLRVLTELCAFITRNLPFVREVALMGCEPIGYALAHREVCEVDIAA
jgi:His-Xaa-Ser system radical SAM maturase HxsC